MPGAFAHVLYCNKRNEVGPMEHNLTLEYWVDEGWFVGRIRQVPGVFSQGETLEELEDNIRDAWKMVLEEAEPIGSSNVQEKELVLDS